jgi:GNAT superfamily N-acetyltransferase
MPKADNFELRVALASDYKAIESLISTSARHLGAADYTQPQIEAALQTAFGLDTQLITDRTYFLIECGKVAVGCGGWSFRETLFGSDAEQSRNPQRLDPLTGTAKIRAFFVNPEYSRMGIGSMIMHKCEREALRAGFSKLELMSTLPGIKLYEKHGFVAGNLIHHPIGKRLTIDFVPMHKTI